MRIGVYICHCGRNIAGVVSSAEVAAFAATLPNVVVSRDYIYLCSDPGQEVVRDDIVNYDLDRVVIAACPPSMHYLTFMNNVQKAGLNPYCLERANIREWCSWPHWDWENKKEITEKAKHLVAAAVAKVTLSEPLEAKEFEVIPNALVIGGGITGIQTTIDLGKMGFKVFLVEKKPYLGGHMAQLNKTFPNLDDAGEMLKTKLEELNSLPNIEILTSSEVTGVEGYVGNFRVKVRKTPTYIDEEKCTHCGHCTEACPISVPDEFNLGLNQRKAIYLPPPPDAHYLIDTKACLYLQGEDCFACRQACQLGAIDFSQKEETLELAIGTIVVATGYEIFDSHLKPEYGYGVYKNVITGLELERLAATSGPTGGEIRLNGKEPKNVVFIQCVGSRDKSVGNEYCSHYCCTATTKQAHYIKEQIPDAKVTVCYIDIRAFQKGCEQFYERVQKEGVNYRRGNVSEVYRREDRLVVRAEDTLLGEFFEEEADLVVLAIGMVPPRETSALSRILRIATGNDGFFLELHPKLAPVETITEGITIAGCCQGPKDITDSVSQAHATAAKASIPLFLGRLMKEPLVPSIDEEICTGCRVCEQVCEYGALVFDERRRVMSINEALCRGCGACSVSCPSGANQVRNSTKKQTFDMMAMFT